MMAAGRPPEQGVKAEPDSEVLLSVIIPAPSPGLNLPLLLKILPAVVTVPHEVIVVREKEPGSSGAPLPLRGSPPGLTVLYTMPGEHVLGALRAGVSAARGKYLLVFAADEVGPVMAIDEMLQKMEAGYDLVSSTRYAGGGRRLGGSLLQHGLSRAANWVFHEVLGGTLSDSTTGIKMFRRSVFEKLNLEARPVGWAVAFEMAVKAEVAGLRIGEVPIVSIDRLYGGQSSFETWPSVREYLRWAAWGLPKMRAAKKGTREGTR